MSRFSFSRPSIITLSAALGFLLGLGLLFLVSESMALLPLALQDGIVRIPSAFGTDLNFLIGYFACFAAVGGLLGFAAPRRKKGGREGKAHLHEPHPSASRHSFTLIELLIVVAVIAVLATVVILLINPTELLRQARDANRVSDLATMNQALTLFNEDVVRGNMGSSSVVYVSVPDPAATSTSGTDCTGIGLASSSLPTGWSWHCAASSTYRDVNGTGWLPVDFTKVSSGSPLGSLPVDPTNTTSTELYYAYVVNGDPWELTANVESQKYGMGGSHDVVTKDGGQYPDLYEVGTDLTLDPVDYDPSLVGYWKFDEGSGTVAYDSSGHGNNGQWYGTQAGSSGYYSPGYNQAWAGYFDGGTNHVDMPGTASNTVSGSFTASVWVNFAATSSTSEEILSTRQSVDNSFDMQARPVQTPVEYIIHGDIGTGSSWLTTSADVVESVSQDYNVWDNFVYVVTPSGYTIYFDGKQAGGGSYSGTPLFTDVIHYARIGNFSSVYLNALVQNVRVYSRALSASEVQAIYNAEK